MNIFRKGDDGKSLILGIRHNGSLRQFLYAFLQAYKDRTEALSKPPIGETSIAQKLDAIIEMLMPLGSLPSRLEQVENRLEIIHGLIFDLGNPPSQPKLKGRFTLILKNNQPDFGYDFDVAGITDEEGEAITDAAVLAGIVKDVSSDNTGVVSVTPPDEGGAGTVHIGTSGAASVSAKAWLSQADKDAGKDPAFLAVEPFTITTGDPAAITEGTLKFDIDSGGTPPVEG